MSCPLPPSLRVGGGRTLVSGLSNTPSRAPGAPRGPSLCRTQGSKDHRAPKASLEFNAWHRGDYMGRRRALFSSLTIRWTGLPVQKLSLKTRRQLPLPGPAFHILPFPLFLKM